MKITLRKPYSDDYDYGDYQVTRNVHRVFLYMFGEKIARTSTTYARYLIETNTGRYLSPDVKVMRIDPMKGFVIGNLEVIKNRESPKKEKLKRLVTKGSTMINSGQGKTFTASSGVLDPREENEILRQALVDAGKDPAALLSKTVKIRKLEMAIEDDATIGQLVSLASQGWISETLTRMKVSEISAIFEKSKKANIFKMKQDVLSGVPKERKRGRARNLTRKQREQAHDAIISIIGTTNVPFATRELSNRVRKLVDFEITMKQMSTLKRELRDAGLIEVVGRRSNARWLPVKEDKEKISNPTK